MISTRKTRRGAGYGHVPGPQKNSTTWIIGGAIGGFVLLILVIAVASSGGSRSHGAVPDHSEAPRPVDVSGLEQQGMAKCEEGYAIIQQCEGMMSGRKLSASEKSGLKERLGRGVRLIGNGMSMLDEANQKTNFRNKYDTMRYMKASRAARYKLGELGGK